MCHQKSARGECRHRVAQSTRPPYLSVFPVRIVYIATAVPVWGVEKLAHRTTLFPGAKIGSLKIDAWVCRTFSTCHVRKLSQSDESHCGARVVRVANGSPQRLVLRASGPEPTRGRRVGRSRTCFARPGPARTVERYSTVIPVSLTSFGQRRRSAARNTRNSSGLLAMISESANSRRELMAGLRRILLSSLCNR